jgi:hypothetical protein
MKHVEFHPENKFEKLVHLVGFLIKMVKCIYGNIANYAQKEHLLNT